AGVSAKSNDETIAAQLEGLLNAGAATPGYQVLNFGAPGNYVFNEMTRYVSQVTHLDPDIVVFFDGYNDALYASFEHVRQTLPAPIMNWADYSYIAFDRWNGIRSQLRSQPPAVFTYAFLLVQRLQEKYVVGDSLGGSADLRAQFYEDYYLYRLSQNLRKTDPFYAGALEENLSFLAGYHIGRERLFLAYLQASPLAYRNLAPERAAGVDPLDAPVSEAADEKTNVVFLENMRGAFEAFTEVYGRLDNRYAASANIRFFDIRRLFENVDEHVYNDIIHTNVRGNQIIAERMMADIRALETNAWNK
ncbi:MAG: SGNH/GDSL hydrolase family protein, partial [Rhodospirillaceae bacterium]